MPTVEEMEKMDQEKIKVIKDGNAWGVIWGESPESIEGWGPDPMHAMIDFALCILEKAEGQIAIEGTRRRLLKSITHEDLSLYRDGDYWIAEWSGKMHEGIKGKGDTEDGAIFDLSWQSINWMYENVLKVPSPLAIKNPDQIKIEIDPAAKAHMEDKIQGIRPDMIIPDDVDGPVELSKKGKEKAFGGNIIQGYGSSRKIYIDGQELLPGDSQKVYNHSPDGFAWGYGGSGPAQLALAILLRFTDQGTAQRLYQTFKFEHVASWPNEDFSVILNVEKWINSKKGDSHERTNRR